MVSIGTVLTLGIIGAGIAGAYALYRSGGAIGGALSRGVETSLVNPLVDWANNLFKIPPVSAVGPGSTVPSNTKADIIVQAGGKVINTGFVDDPNKFNPPGVTGYGLPGTPQGTPTPTPDVTVAGIPTAAAAPTPAPSKAGYYYWNRPGPNDKQLGLKVGTADKLRLRGRELHYLSRTKLTEAGFKLFGQSKAYL